MVKLNYKIITGYSNSYYVFAYGLLEHDRYMYNISDKLNCTISSKILVGPDYFFQLRCYNV